MIRPLALLPLLALAACGGSEPPSTPGALHRAGMANPAAVYCTRLGGRLEIRAEPAGQSGYCHLPDGRTIEEWQLYRDASPL